jgi:membrane-associated phospholipid phosphatase
VLALLGAGCLAGVLLLGVAVGDGGTRLDRALMPTGLCAGETAGTVCENLATEGGWPFPVYATALAPLLAAGLLLLGRLCRGGEVAAGGWLWSLAAAAALPAQLVLSTVFDRAGPLVELRGRVDPDGAYPSGAAALVAVAWGIGGVVVWRLRPRWRPGVVVLTAVVLAAHGVTRAAALKHWPTDIVGSYLLAGGALLLAAAFAPAAGSAGAAAVPAEPLGAGALPDRDVGGDPHAGRQGGRVTAGTEPHEDGALGPGAGREDHL